jgi:hypothetical protein
MACARSARYNSIFDTREDAWRVGRTTAGEGDRQNGLDNELGGTVKLEPPLANLIARCQTLCVAECCGIDAYDFSPIQIASYLTMYRGKPDVAEVRTLRGQIDELRTNYGLAGAHSRGVTLEELNQGFTAEQIEALASELSSNLDVALTLVEKSEELRYIQSKQGPAAR